MLSTNMFPPDAALPQIFDKTKDQKVIHKDTNDSWNSVLHLLVYSKYPIAQSHLQKYGFYLHVSTRSCPARKFLMKRKIKKSYIKT